MSTISLEILTTYLIAINLVAFAAFGIDKALAEGGRRRISEARLIGWALMGGTLGAYAGRHLFRHKTCRQSFSNRLHMLAIAQLAALVFVAVLWWPA